MLVFDGHCDTLSKITEPQELIRNSFHWDITRAAGYGTFIQVMAAFAGDRYRANPASVMNAQLEKAMRFELLHPDMLTLIRSRADLQSSSRGGVYGILSAEGAEILNGSMEELDRLYQKGLRVMNLCWNYDNEVCDSVAGRRTHRGLSTFGRRVVGRMQELGIIVDLSHASDETFEQAMGLLRIPAVASHSNCRAICRNPRNLTDRQILSIAGIGGVIGINLYTRFLSDGESAGIKDVMLHIEHMAGLVGAGHIGLGCDFDGCESIPAEINGVGRINRIFDVLARANYTDEAIEGIAGKNFFRMFTQVLN